MRYVFIAVAALAAVLVWLDQSSDGRQVRRHMMDHRGAPAGPD